MINLFRNFFAKPYTCPMELHNEYGCYISAYHPADYIESFREFFKRNNFIIAHNMFDEKWDEKIKLEEIFKKLIMIFNFNPNDENIILVYKKHKKVYLPNRYYVDIPTGGIFVYDKSKINISY